MKKPKKEALPPTNLFLLAVEATSDISTAYQIGLQALSDHSKLVILGDNRQCEGSVEIDEAVRAKYPQDNRWDYMFSYKGKVFFVEVHSAHTNEVGTVIRKLEWLKNWLKTEAPEINHLKADVPFYWIQSSGYHILKQSSQARQIAQKGIKPIAKLTLK